MTDKVYPMHDADYRHADADRTASHPSAPPLHGSTRTAVAVQMPERAIRKEQETGLMSQYEHVQTRQNDDHIYAAPPPQATYQSYDAKAYTGENYALAPGGRPRRRRSPCCCCLLSFIGTLGTLILIVGIAALVVYLVVRPIRKPKYDIQGVEVREFNVSTQGGASVLNTHIDLTLVASNPNKKIGIDYNDIEVKVFYEGDEIGEGSTPGFYQGHRTTTTRTIPIEGDDITLTSAATSALQSNTTMWMAAEAKTRARIKIGRWHSWRHTFHLHCSLQLGSSPHLGPLDILSSSCKLKKPKFFFFGVHT